MKQDTLNEGITPGIIGVGAATSLGFHLVNKIAENKRLIEEGLISRILIHDIRKDRVDSIIKDHIESGVEIEIEKADLQTIAKEADVYVFTYAAPGGAQKKYHGIDKELRRKLFNANIPVMYSKKMREAFEGAKGLGIFCTNPSDNLAYFSTEIFGWDKDQANGFNHADTFRLQNQKEVPIDFSDAFMIGDHGPNSFAHFTPELYAQLMEYCKNNPALVDKTIQDIIKSVHRKGFEIFEVMEHSNANCATPLMKVIEGIATGKGIFQMSQFINIPELPENIRKRLQELEKITGETSDGIKTGIPVVYKRKNGVYRPEIADGFGKEHDFDLNALDTAPASLQYNERQKFFGVFEKNIDEVLTAKHCSKRGLKQAMLPVENSLLVIHTLLNSDLLVYETKKDVISKDTSLMYPQKQAALTLKTPEIKAVAASNNRLVIIQPEGKVILKKFPKRKLESLADENTTEPKEVELGSIASSVRLAAMHDDEVYLADSKRIEKRNIADFNKPDITEQTLDKNIWSIYADSNGALCACSDGEIKELDSQLSEIGTYTSKEKNSKMIKVKRIEFNDKKYIFALNEDGSIHMWNPQETDSKLKSSRACFDVQIETDGKKEFICVYHVGANDTMEITRICPETAVLETKSTDITCSSDIKDIQAQGNEVYLVSNNRVRSFLNKETRNMDIPLPNQFINKIVHIHYKK